LTNIRTIHRRKVQEILESANILSTFRWLPASEWRGVFSLSGVVTNIRWNRKKPTTAEQLQAFVREDQNIREGRDISGRADISVRGAGVTGKEFIGVMTWEELNRWKVIESKLLHGFMKATQLHSQLPDVSDISLNPSVARFILSGEGDELPSNIEGWAAFSLSAAIVNCNPQLEIQEAA